MFLAARDLFFAKGRFALMGTVIIMITLLLVMLTGLTGGLGKQNTALLQSLGADRLVFSDNQVSFTDSAVTQADLESWQEASGITSAQPVGLTQTKVEGKQSVAAALAGIPQDSDLLRKSVGSAADGSEELDANSLVVGKKIADEAGLSVGDKVKVGGIEFTVSGITADTFYSHLPVAWVSTANWQALSRVQNQDIVGTVLAVTGQADFDRLSTQTKTRAVTLKDAFAGLPAYKSEQGSLLTMQGFLYGISALVTISFLTVWTIQRTRDIAVLRALGASTRYLLTDSLVQAGIILFAGSALGALLGWALGLFAQKGVPFDLSLLTVAAPATGIFVLGIIGAFFAVARVRKTDPLLALGGN